jgi:hypothetical protein
MSPVRLAAMLDPWSRAQSDGYHQGPGSELMAQFKGTIFASARLFTEREFGTDAVERVLQRLEPADADLLRGVTAVGWYPVEPVLRYHHALEQLCGRPGSNFELCERLGTFSAEWAINSILKVFIRFKSPHFLMQKNATLWGRYHDSGRWETPPEEPGRVGGRLYEFAVQDEAFCARLRGWLCGAVKMTGGRDARASEPRCRCRGDEYCEYLVEYR